jgi:hypothetical protein
MFHVANGDFLFDFGLVSFAEDLLLTGFLRKIIR